MLTTLVFMNVSIIAFLANYCFNMSFSCFLSLCNFQENKFLYQISFRSLKSKFFPFNPNLKMLASSLGFIATPNTEIVTQVLSRSENICEVC